MSGIVGIVNTDGAPVDRDLLRRFTAFMRYRGPDEQAVWIDGSVGFGHAMLRTTDESVNECQPMSLDGRVWITADARIDGRAELRAKLNGGRVNQLDLANDIELILHAYCRWDTGCVDHLLGDFAFAIWDGAKQRLFCARDHFGVKPFFYARIGNLFLFGNTLNCLRLHPAVSDTLNEVAIGDFLLFGSNQDPATTTFADIQRLPGAHRLTLAADRIDVRRYWSLPIDGHIRYPRAGDYVDHFEDILRIAVNDRLRTSTIAVEMSGGLDSPSIAATAKDILVRRGKPFDIRAYTCVYDRLLTDRDRPFASLAARALGIPMNCLPMDDFPLFERSIPGDIREPEPFFSYPRSLAGADFWERAAVDSRVLLTGWDGDALMAESPRHYFYALLRKGEFAELAEGWAWFLRVKRALPPMGFRTWLKRQLGKDPGRSLYPSWVEPSFAARIGLRARWTDLNAEALPMHPTRPMASTMLFVPNWWTLFEGYDPGVRGFAQEARHPLMDRRLVDYVLGIPPVPWSIDKHILRCAMQGKLPDPLRLRPKAPLAGDPAVELVRNVASHQIDAFLPVQPLSDYVVRGAVQPISGETNCHRLWLNTRPYALNRWFENALSCRARSCPEARRGSLHGCSAEDKECANIFECAPRERACHVEVTR